MTISGLIRDLKHYGIFILAAVVAVTGPIAVVESLYYRGLIETLEERINLLRDRVDFLEAKLKAPGEFSLPSPSVSTPNTSVPEEAAVAPNHVVLKYPPIKNPSQLTRSEVRRLAVFYTLFKEWKVNPHLRFEEGDVSYWYERGLSEQALKNEFEARRIVLERAEETGENIPTQGDLSYLANEIKANLSAGQD